MILDKFFLKYEGGSNWPPYLKKLPSKSPALLVLKKGLASHIRILCLIFTYFSLNFCGYLLRSNFPEHKKINFREKCTLFYKGRIYKKKPWIVKIEKLSTYVTMLTIIKKYKCWKTIYLLGWNKIHTAQRRIQTSKMERLSC